MHPETPHIAQVFKGIQDDICEFLLTEEEKKYQENKWTFSDSGSGGGVTRVWENGTLIERGGVNYSHIKGDSLPKAAAIEFSLREGTPYTAVGVSLVLHPHNPFVPTIHMNIRFFETEQVWWFGGGIDVTPVYADKNLVIDFHGRLKDLCDDYNADYHELKRNCDEYFFLPHRNESRGIGGLFFDHVNDDKELNFNFTTGLGKNFKQLYLPFIRHHKNTRYSDGEKEFQQFRRSRYVEFNLLYDRGTKFGLESNGPIESVLISMPAAARWSCQYAVKPGSKESELSDFYLKPKDWISMGK